MKLLTLLLIAVTLSACETTHPDGSVTRWDSEATTDAIKTTGEVLNQYQRYQQQANAPVYRQPLYNAAGQVIYPGVP